MFCAERKKNTSCEWKFKGWEKRRNVVLLEDCVGYLKSPIVECTKHSCSHCIASHLAILKKNSTVSQDLIKVNDYWISEECMKLLFNWYKDNSNFSLCGVRRQYLQMIATNITTKFKQYKKKSEKLKIE